MQSEGLDFVGLHWLIMSPPGLHVTTPDADLRRRGWEHIRDLIDLCADLGPNGVMVFGSPKQRATTGGSTREEATRRMAEGLAAAAPHAADRAASLYCSKPCPSVNATWCNRSPKPPQSSRQSVARRSKPCSTFTTPSTSVSLTPALIERYYGHIRHVHVNELDGRHCGAGDYDFRPIFETLRRLEYPGWISLEAFDFSVGAERLAEESLRHLETQSA